LLAAIFALVLAWAAGEASARALFGRHYRNLSAALRLPLGLATIVCLLEAAGFFLPLRIGSYVALAPALVGLVLIARRRKRPEPGMITALCAGLCGLLLGLVPMVIAGRLTAAAITNNDATYYITVADRLIEIPWSIDSRTLPAECLRERVLKGWFWRTGTPSLMAAVSTLLGLSTTEAIAIVTALLMACVPCTALVISHALGIRKGGRAELVVAAISALSAESLFLGYQHLTGQLGAYVFFPLACGAMLGASRHGGIRRTALAGILLGAALALLADAGAVLALGVAAGLVGARRRPFRAIARVLAVVLAAAAFAPFTVYRAIIAGLSTAAFRVGKPQPMFPQGGWLERTVLDDLATVTGVDPWPPWPAPWPPTVQSIAGALGALSAAALLGLAVLRLRRDSGKLALAVLMGGATALSLVVVGPNYLIGKILLMTAAFAVPMWATGAAWAVTHRRLRWLVLPAVLAQLAALSVLCKPSRWKVIDRIDHDRLVGELAKLPSGAYVVFDGLGAPADAVLDAHRAYRAALLAGLVPVHPGMDGGFYRPRCPDPLRPEPLPSRAYALQRRSAETLTRGTELISWGDFALIEADLEHADGFVGAWAPTYGWITAEREPDGRIFRWAGAEASAALRVIQPAPCVHLTGELRTAQGEAIGSIYEKQSPLFNGFLASEWTKFVSRPLEASIEREIIFKTEQRTGAPPDDKHAVALRGLRIVPNWQCLLPLGADAKGGRSALPVDFHDLLEWKFAPAVGIGCAEIVALVAPPLGGTLGIAVDGGPIAWTHISTATVRASSLPTSLGKAAISVRLIGRGGEKGTPWRLLDLALHPRSSCP
jgi:hypothetical protein